MRPTLAAAAIALVPLVSGCAAAVFGVGAGVVISQEVLDSLTHVAQLEEDPARVWVVAKSTLSHMASDPLHVDEDLRALSGTVDGQTVVISVETYDQNRTMLRVGARSFGIPHNETAERVLNTVIQAVGS